MNLVSVAAVSKRLIKLLIAIIVLYLIFIISRPIVVGIVRSLIPERDPPRTIYGKLEQLSFIEQPITNKGEQTYELNTRTGELPTEVPNRMVIYRAIPTQPSFEAGKRAQADAFNIGYTDQDLVTDLKGTEYSWRNIVTQGVLNIQINSRTLSTFTDLTDKNEFYNSGSITKPDALKKANFLLDTIGRKYPEANAKITLGKYFGGRVIEASTALDGQVARVDFFRKFGPVSVFGPNPTKGNLHLIIGNPNTQLPTLNYPILELYSSNYETESEATYPIIPVSSAWQAITEGKGVFASVEPKDLSPFEQYNPVKVDQILINNITIAYYDSRAAQRFLQPIYVFQGNYNTQGDEGGAITLYYPAVSPEFVSFE